MFNLLQQLWKDDNGSSEMESPYFRHRRRRLCRFGWLADKIQQHKYNCRKSSCRSWAESLSLGGHGRGQLTTSDQATEWVRPWKLNSGRWSRLESIGIKVDARQLFPSNYIIHVLSPVAMVREPESGYRPSTRPETGLKKVKLQRQWPRKYLHHLFFGSHS